MVFARFLPKNEAFFELFDAAAENAAEVATVLAAVIAAISLSRDSTPDSGTPRPP